MKNKHIPIMCVVSLVQIQQHEYAGYLMTAAKHYVIFYLFSGHGDRDVIEVNSFLK